MSTRPFVRPSVLPSVSSSISPALINLLADSRQPASPQVNQIRQNAILSPDDWSRAADF
jgi:hypothetical protein